MPQTPPIKVTLEEHDQQVVDALRTLNTVCEEYRQEVELLKGQRWGLQVALDNTARREVVLQRQVQRLLAALDEIQEISTEPAFESDAMGWITQACIKARDAVEEQS